MHNCAIPASSKESVGGYASHYKMWFVIDHSVYWQQTLDDNLVPCVPPFTKLGLTDWDMCD